MVFFVIHRTREETHEARNYPLLAAAILLFIAPACLAQTQFPDTPAGNQAKAWLEVFNAGDAEKHKEFLRKNAPTRVERADREMGFREMTGGFDVKKVEESTPTKIVALVQERASDQLARFTLEVGAGPPHQITRLGLEATATTGRICPSSPERERTDYSTAKEAG